MLNLVLLVIETSGALLYHNRRVERSFKTSIITNCPQYFYLYGKQEGENMKSRTVLSIFVLMIATLACNLPGGAPQLEVVPTNTPQPLFTETPTQASLPTQTPLPTLTPTPTVPIAWPSDKGVNCRYGPSTDWVSVGSLFVGKTAKIRGRNDVFSWWYVTTRDSGHCGVAASVPPPGETPANLLIISPPQAQVTSVK